MSEGDGSMLPMKSMNPDAGESVVTAHSTAADINGRLLNDAIEHAKHDTMSQRRAQANAGFGFNPETPTQRLAATIDQFRHEALAAAGNVGDPWVAVVRELVTDVDRRYQVFAELMSSPPDGPESTDGWAEHQRWHDKVRGAAGPVRAILSTYCDQTTSGMTAAVEEHKKEARQLAKRERERKDGIALQQQSDSVVNILLNVLHVYQFNMNVIHVHLGERIESEVAKAPEPVRAELRALSASLCDAVASGDKSRMKEAIEAVMKWSQANPDRAINVVGILVTLILGLLGLAVTMAV